MHAGLLKGDLPLFVSRYTKGKDIVYYLKEFFMARKSNPRAATYVKERSTGTEAEFDALLDDANDSADRDDAQQVLELQGRTSRSSLSSDDYYS